MALDLAGTLRSRDRCVVVAEVAQAHEGSLGMAHAFVDAAARAGADAVKFQTHIAAAESTPVELWRVRFSSQDATRYDYWRRMEFSPAGWRELAEHARAAGLLFLSSPFSLAAVGLLEEIGVAAWKVASGELATPGLLAAMARSGLPFLVSTGMSDWAEIDDTVGQVRATGAPFAVLQCTSLYPCPPEKVGLDVLAELRRRHPDAAVGLSDHSGTIYPGLAAATLGIEVLEVHLTLSRQMFGPDVPVSLTGDELRQLVEGVRFIERMRRSPVDKDALAAELAPMRRLFTKSVVAARDLAAGTVVGADDVAFKKPGSGIPAASAATVIGRRLRHDVAADHLFAPGDLAEVAE